MNGVAQSHSLSGATFSTPAFYASPCIRWMMTVITTANGARQGLSGASTFWLSDNRIIVIRMFDYCCRKSRGFGKGSEEKVFTARQHSLLCRALY